MSFENEMKAKRKKKRRRKEKNKQRKANILTVLHKCDPLKKGMRERET